MLGFTKQEQRFVLFLLVTFAIGLGVSYVRKARLARPADDWREKRQKLIAEFKQASEKAPQDTTRLSIKEQKAAFTGTININTAGAKELQLLPGIGPVTAEKIIQHRNEHGTFKNINELLKIKGIGPKTLEKIKSNTSMD